MRPQKLGLVLTVVAALLGACSSPDEVREEPSQAGAAIAFCQDFSAAMCQQLWRCGCTEPALEVCEYQQTSCAKEGFFAQLEAGISQGLLRYDARAAERVIARIRDEPMECSDRIVALGFDSYDRTFGGAFIGTLAAGSDCGEADVKEKSGVSFCREGLLCLPSADGANRCVAIAGPGAPCPIVPNHAGSSCFERRPPDANGEFTSAVAGLTCVPDGSGSETGSCTLRVADGANCTVPAECASGRCAFTVEPPVCAALLSDGADCLIDEDCASRACRYEDGTASLGRCDPKGVLPSGAACATGAECESGWCDAGVCLAPICIDFAP